MTGKKDQGPTMTAAGRPGSYPQTSDISREPPATVALTNEEARYRRAACAKIGCTWTADLADALEYRNQAYDQWRELFVNRPPGDQSVGEAFEVYRCWQENLADLKHRSK